MSKILLAALTAVAISAASMPAFASAESPVTGVSRPVVTGTVAVAKSAEASPVFTMNTLNVGQTSRALTLSSASGSEAALNG